MRTAFISYSWDSEDHKKWVFDLASRLHCAGITVIFDQKNLVPGDQLTQFMETSVRESDFVLVVCTERYKERSDSRTGGVGYEGHIMSGELMNDGNQRKFIPILRGGTWNEASPSWVSGKYYIDLSANPYSESNFNDLLSTILGTRSEKQLMAVQHVSIDTPSIVGTAIQDTSGTQAFEPIHISHIVIDEIGVPKGDGTKGSALYVVPFRLSRHPPSEWSRLFIEAWNHPESYSSMHRPGIASISADTIVLDGTTVEEVGRYHKETLVHAVNNANSRYAFFEESRVMKEQAERDRVEKHAKAVNEAAKGIAFDD